jgi:glyoxalase/bleomycin resistance protein/dioxygenase superfamily protein
VDTQRTTILPGDVRQNGYVVPDLDAAIAAWLALGVGPWVVLPPAVHGGMVHRGEPTEPELTIAFANSGPLQIELIEQRNRAPSLYREFSDAGRSGFHHLAWWADDFDAFEAAAEREDWSLVTTGNAGGFARFCYIELDPITSTAIEVMEHNDVTRGLFDHVARASVSWDGTNPVRVMR